MKSHKEFIGDVERGSSLPARTNKALSEEAQTPSDLKAIAKRDTNVGVSE